MQYVNGVGKMPVVLQQALVYYCQERVDIEIAENKITLVYPVAVCQTDKRHVRLVRRCQPDTFHLWTLTDGTEVFFYQVDQVIEGTYVFSFSL